MGEFFNARMSVFLLSCALSCTSIADGWTGYGNFTSLECFSNNNSAITPRCAIINFNGSADDTIINYCGKGWGVLHLPGENAPFSKEIFSSLMMAFTTGKQIKILTNGCSDGYPLIGGAAVKY